MIKIYKVDLDDFERYLKEQSHLKSLIEKWHKLIDGVNNPDTVGSIGNIEDQIETIVAGYIYRTHIAWKVDKDSTYFAFCKYAIDGALEVLNVYFDVRSEQLNLTEQGWLKSVLRHYADVVYLKSKDYKLD